MNVPVNSLTGTKARAKAFACFKCRQLPSVNCSCKRNPKTPSLVSVCKYPSGEERNVDYRPPRKRAYFNESQHSQVRLSRKKKRESDESEIFGSTKKKMAIDDFLNSVNQPNMKNMEPAATISGVPRGQSTDMENPSASRNILLPFSESSENFHNIMCPEEVGTALARLIENPVANTRKLTQIEDSFPPISVPPLPEERNGQAPNQNMSRPDMKIEDLICSEDEIEGDSDSETTVTAPVNEDDLHSLLEDIMSMDEVLHILDMYDSEGIVTTTGLVPTYLEDYPLSWSASGWNEAEIAFQHFPWS